MSKMNWQTGLWRVMAARTSLKFDYSRHFELHPGIYMLILERPISHGFNYIIRGSCQVQLFDIQESELG